MSAARTAFRSALALLALALSACNESWSNSSDLNVVTVSETDAGSGSGEVAWGGVLQFENGCPVLRVGDQTWDLVFPYGSRAVERGSEKGVLLPSGKVLVEGEDSSGEEVVVEDPLSLDVIDKGDCWKPETARNVSYVVQVYENG